MSTITVQVSTPAGPALIRVPDDLRVGELSAPLAQRAGVVATAGTRLRHDHLGLLDPTATLAGLGLSDGTVLRIVLTPTPTPNTPPTPRPPDALPLPLIAVGWVGAHGGAGTTTHAQLLGGADHHTTPRPGTAATVIVARPTASGLQAAQHVARTWTLGPPPRGLVLIAATPGRLPRPLRELRDLVTGAYPHTWHIPWIEPLHRGDPPPPVRALDQLATDLELTTHHPT